MNTLDRIVRHARITRRNYERRPSPPFLILFINSICNQKCEHCFYWQNLNRRDDLSKEEIFSLQDQLGRVEHLSLSGGEPFLRPEFGEICRRFIRVNKVRQIYVPTNSTWTEKMVTQITETLKEPDLDFFVAEMSLDGLGDYHDKFRGQKGAFRKAMESYEALAELQEQDPRLRIHSISTATAVNMDEIRKLTTFLYDHCPKMDHHNLAIMRGDPKNPGLTGPQLAAYNDLYDYIQRLWSGREEGRYGSIVEPMLQWAKTESIAKQTQVIPCRAGILSAVVYSNGDVSMCELHEPLGNLRKESFEDIWFSKRADDLRHRVACKECWCTTEVFMWPSMIFQPGRMIQAMLGAKVWRGVQPLDPAEKLDVTVDEAFGTSSEDYGLLAEIQTAENDRRPAPGREERTAG